MRYAFQLVNPNLERDMLTLAFMAILASSLTSPPAMAARDTTPAIVVEGAGRETYVLVSGMVGGVAGFRRLGAQLIQRGYRVIILDPYRLSIDSADVSFAAMARRVDRVLALYDVRAAYVVAHAHGAGVALRLAA